MNRKGPRILLIGGTYRALCVLEHLLERGERVVAFLGQEREEERDFCSEILEVCDRSSIPARSGRKLGEEMVRWLEDRIRPDLAIAVGLSGEVPLSVGGNCRLGLVEVVDLFQFEACPGIVLRQRGQEVLVREVPRPAAPEEREDTYLRVIDETLEALDDYLSQLGTSAPSTENEVPFDSPPLPFEQLARLVDRSEPGAATTALEGAVARYLDAQHVYAVGSVADAFVTLLHGLGVGEGDEVVCPGIVSAAVLDAVQRCGARAVRVDVEPDRLTLDPERIADAASARTRAMVVSHPFGQPAPLGDLYGVARELGIEVIEDGGSSFGARLGDSRLGRGPCTCVFRFPTRAGGGVPHLGLVTLPEGLQQRLDERLGSLRVGDGLASLAAETVSRFEDILSKRRELAGAYGSALVPYDAFSIPPTPEDALSAYPVFLLRLTRFARTTADDLYKLLLEAGVETRRLVIPFPERELAHLPFTEEARSSGLLLPLRPDLSQDEAARTLDVIFDYTIG